MLLRHSAALLFPAIVAALVLPLLLGSCGQTKPPEAPAVHLRDSLPIMTTYGVSKLISDSGVIRYKIVAEEWKVYDRTHPNKQTFEQGLLLEKFNQQFHVEMYITADTAYWYNDDLWELRGRVCVWKEDGTVFRSQLLYWNMTRHEFYSNRFSTLTSPTKNVQGASFHSNEQMTQYEVDVTSATFPLPENGQAPAAADSTATTDQNGAPTPGHPAIEPRRSTEKPDPTAPKGHFK